MKTAKEICSERSRTKIHFTDNYLLNPTNPITVNVVGAGGTGSKVLTALVEMSHSLTVVQYINKTYFNRNINHLKNFNYLKCTTGTIN